MVIVSVSGLVVGAVVVPPVMLFGSVVASGIAGCFGKKTLTEEQAWSCGGACAGAALLVSCLDSSPFSRMVKIVAIAGSLIGGGGGGLVVGTTRMAESDPAKANNLEFKVNSLKWASIGVVAGCIISAAGSTIDPTLGCMIGTLSSYAISAMGTYTGL